MEKIKLQSGFTRETNMKSNQSGRPVRPEFPKDKIKSSISLGKGVTQSINKPKDEHGMNLVCPGEHNNYVYGLPGTPPFMRIGSVRSSVLVVGCLTCGERLKGGEDF